MRWLSNLIRRNAKLESLRPTREQMDRAREIERGEAMMELAQASRLALEAQARAWGVENPDNFTYLELIEEIVMRRYPDLDDKFER